MSRTHQTSEREDEAAAMLTSTRLSRGVAPTLIALFLAALLGVPVAQHFLPDQNASRKAKTQNAKTQNALSVFSMKRVPEGRELRAVEKNLETDSRFFAQTRPETQSFLTRYLRAGNGEVVVGIDNWLFYDKEIRAITGRAFPVNEATEITSAMRDTVRQNRGEQLDSVPAIVDLRDQLARRGIELIVMPIPVKATIYPEKLWPSYRESPHLPRNAAMKKWRQTLERHRVRVLDITSDLLLAKRRGEAVFVPTDTHWTPRGAEIAAQKLSSEIVKLNVLTSRAPTELARRPVSQLAPNDLVRVLGLPKNQSLFARRAIVCNAVYTKSGAFPAAQRDADILILGDSFCGFYTNGGAALPQQLAFEVKRPVDWLVVANGGSYMSRVKLIQQAGHGRDHLAGKRVVVLEFTVRDLSFGNWKILDLPK